MVTDGGEISVRPLVLMILAAAVPMAATNRFNLRDIWAGVARRRQYFLLSLHFPDGALISATVAAIQI
jgi:hypothetical protein